MMSAEDEARMLLAGLAMQGLLSSGRYLGADVVAKLAVAASDALLLELEPPR